MCLQRHFDNAQYESHRADGVQKLRPDAVPMLFDLTLRPVPLPIHVLTTRTPDENQLQSKVGVMFNICCLFE